MYADCCGQQALVYTYHLQDEIGTEAEALAARSIAQRGVQLVATAHWGELARLIKNPTLSDLIGGIQTCAPAVSSVQLPVLLAQSELCD